MGFWIATSDGETEWVDGDMNQDLYALTRKRQWYYTGGLTSWLPSLGGNLNQELPVYVSAKPAIARDLKDLRNIAIQASKGASHSLAPMITSLLEMYSTGIVRLLHREERAEAFIQLVAHPSPILYNVRYKTNDPDRAWRLSYMVHELVHAECDQRYRYHASNRIPALNANGDVADAKNDFTIIKGRLDEIVERTERLEAVVDKVADDTLKTYLKARLGRAGNNTNEWDTVMTELYLYLFLSLSTDKKAMAAVRECAEDAASHRHTHRPRGTTRRPGGVN